MCPRLTLSALFSLSYSVFIGLVVVLAMCAAAWFLSPKGENRVYVLAILVVLVPHVWPTY